MSRSSAFISCGVEAAAGAHAAVTGHGGEHVVEALGDDETPLAFGKLVGEIAQQILDVALAEQRRHLAHDDGRRAEGLDHEAETLQARRRLPARRSAASASSSTTSGMSSICREMPPLAKAFFRRS